MHDRLHWMFLKPIRQYTQKLPKTIDERVVNITDDIFTMIYSELPDTVEKLVEPAVQDTLLKIQKNMQRMMIRH